MLASLKPGDQVSIHFRVSERTVKFSTLGVEYTLVLRGSTVVSINPPGKYRPPSSPPGVQRRLFASRRQGRVRPARPQNFLLHSLGQRSTTTFVCV
jgi:hypothetical protein